jgi:1-deoxy-D-xylulose 5-phosphate reductoisomerase
LVHAIVEYKNGLSSMLYHYNDMKIPIGNALYNNLYIKKNLINKFNLKQELFFYKAVSKKILSMKILEQRKYLNSSGFIAINVINEILVSKFLNKEILFSDIVRKLLGFLNSRTVKNYLKNNRIQHINDVFKAYNFYRSLLV